VAVVALALGLLLIGRAGTPTTAVADTTFPVCNTGTASNGSTATICINSLTQSSTNPSDFVVNASATWNFQTGDIRGCPTERHTPSGCITWTVDGTAISSTNYLLTHLFKTPTAKETYSNSYTWTWHTENLSAGTHTLYATIKLNNATIVATVPVTTLNSSGQPLASPNAALGGLIPLFAAPTPFTIAAVGDGPSGSVPTLKVADMIKSWTPNMFMYLGDVYQRGSPDEFLDFYDPVYSSLNPQTVAVPGNHEYKVYGSAAPYYWYWQYQNSGPTDPARGAQYYSFDAAGWHFIALNPNIPMTPTSPQGTWLANDLAAHPNSVYPCTLAFWHQERFSDQALKSPGTSALWGPLYKANADVIVNAHSHAFERWLPLDQFGHINTTRGLVQLVAGAGGNVLATPWTSADSRSAFRDNQRWGALRMTLYPDHLHYEFIAAYNKSGLPNGVLDSGDVNCH